MGGTTGGMPMTSDGATSGMPFDPAEIDSPAAFADLLTEARLRAGMSIRDVSRRTEVPVSTLGGYFGGRHLPPPNRPEALRELLAAIRVPEKDHDRWLAALRRAAKGRRTPAPTVSTPYPGLRPYGTDDAATFFGRERATADLTRLVHRARTESDTPLVVVTGASGSGKSSLLRAGLAPALTGWHVVVLEVGDDPAGSLDRIPDPAEDAVGLCLVVDQAERLWSTTDAMGRAEFLERLTAWARPTSAAAPPDDAPPRPTRPRVAVIGLRADFYAQAAEHETLRTALQTSHYIVAPLTATELAEVIVEPAKLAGATVSPDLVAVIVEECMASSGGGASFLPHLAHCLSRMWTKRRGGELTLAMYRDCGGLRTVMRESAESAWQTLSEDRRPLARRLLLAMVQIDPELPTTSRAIALDPLSPGERDILAAFTEARVVTVSEDSASLSHETLIAAWPRLREWIEEDHERLTLVRSLEREAGEWSSSGRDEDLLLRGSRLVAFEDLAESGQTYIGATESEFLAASRVVADRAEQARRRRERQTTALLVAASVLALAAIVAVIGYVTANRNLGLERDAAASRQLAVLASQAGESNQSAGIGLALSALRTADTLEARSALISTSLLGEVTRFAGPVGHRVVATSPDGTVMAVAGADRSILLYDASGEALTEMGSVAAPGGDGDIVFALEFSPDGRTLASGGTGGVVRLVDVSDPRAPAAGPEVGTDGTVYALAWSGGSDLLAGTQNPNVLRWRHEGDTLTPLAPLPTESAVLALATRSSTVAAGDEGGVVTLWTVDGNDATETARASIGAGGIPAVAIEDSGDLLVGGRDRILRRIPVGEDLGEATELLRFGSWVNAIATTEGFVAAGSSDSTVRVLRSADDTTGSELPFAAPVTAVRPLAQSRLAVSLTNGETHVVDLSRARVFPGPGNVFTTRYSADGERLLVVPGTVNRASVYDTSVPGEPSLLTTIEGDDEAGFHGVGAISPDGGLVVVARRDGVVLGFDLTGAGEPRRVFSLPVSDQMPEQLAFSPSGGYFVVGGDDQQVHVVSLVGGEAVVEASLDGPDNYVLGVAIAPDDSTIAAASLDGSLHRWARSDEGWEAIAPIEVGSQLLTVAFHPDGDLLAASGTDRIVRVWDVRDPGAPELLEELAGPDNEVYQLGYSREGELAAASLDQTVTTWSSTGSGADVSHVKEFVLRPGSGALFAVDWRPGGDELVAGGVDGAVHIWDTDLAQIRDQVCGGGGDLLGPDEWERLVGGLEFRPPCG
ncbi:AAA family ATPase [Nostocoides sp. F2B08]|uniref:nSTAND1 domain-containing NTPase n=1 Tax=Nostocoides sp. F2B08 TaxID=2653936 RepID=UPI0012633F50|nr:AAA family ATPase [Tetrasphaera sp. F2B08]KAB7744235.1 AAA family ATPase [Tetrasphaera sp. F2B08]